MGRREKLQAVLKGSPADAVCDAGKPAVHRTKKLGEFAVQSATMKPFKQPPSDYNVYDPQVPKVKPDTSTPLKRAVIDLENAIRRQNFETGAFFDHDGRILLIRHGPANKVSFIENELHRMSGKTFVHNHPENGSFSIDDFNRAREANLYELRAVTQFVRFSAIAPDGWPEESVIRKAIDEVKPWANNEVRQMVLTGELEPRFAQAEAEHIVWRRLCDLLGIKYNRERS